jgi:hypothetical protein
MKNQLNAFNVKALLILALFASVTSCSKDEEGFVEEDLLTIEEAPIVDNLTNACSTRRYTWTKTRDVNQRVSKNIDDRSCKYNYTQVKKDGNTYGLYRLEANDSSDRLQTRIERQGRTVGNARSGNFVEISGTCRITAVGSGDSQDTNGSMSNTNGTYFIQAKGRHTGGGGSPDPAVALFIAKPKTVGSTRYFEIYREEIKYRGGSGNNGRRLVYITRVQSDKDFGVKVRTGFDNRGPNGSFRHYVNCTINGTFKSFPVPDARKGTEAKLRFGAYRCKGGRANIYWRSMGVVYKNN